ncbi:MAG: methyl-accepting chemotaxis protein [Deltaproteobacteria bacterium]|nr:methyl-accepting chemotaxis protein [Deltaproteobacteria bacterium]
MGDKRQRKLRNYLLDRRFQLKYTSMIVLVTVTVAGGLGYVAYGFSQGQTEALTAHIAAQPDLDAETAQDLERFAREEDRKVRNAILIGVLLLTLALGVVGILVTHRVVGPAYRMRRLFERIGEGKLEITTGIRKGDELQELFRSFADMVESLRDQRSEEIAQLEDTLAKMEAAGVQSDHITQLRAVLERIRKTVD